MGRVFTSYPVLQAVTYSGVGNVVSGAGMFCGLRAYSLATIGTNAIRLRGADTVESDFTTVTGGGLDITNISSFIVAHGACTVAKLYDQTGNGFHIYQTVASQQPGFSLTGTGGSKPAMTFARASSQSLATSGVTGSSVSSFFTFSSPQASSHGAFCNLAASHGSFPEILGISEPAGGGAETKGHSLGLNCGHSSGWNEIIVQTGTIGSETSNATAVATDTWVAVTGTSDASSPQVPVIYVDGSALGGAPVTTILSTLASSNLEFSSSRFGNSYWDGSATECYWYNSQLSSVQAASISSNQHSYWGV